MTARADERRPCCIDQAEHGANLHSPECNARFFDDVIECTTEARAIAAAENEGMRS